ncbi:hypothetical protein [Mycolicibacterium sp. P9-22]|uniref:DUF7065 domain-containing protein n=1 Tax=Mycolicibacterium sp. P9-22 TaxID=2024613 RepID=UPI0011EF5504|nr:hypothetical protein [Mycolicibacterium sp. P9-22]KAA0120555.1 hypothetical protein CIW51_03570 [Mycolicibacterium sp. P9-22]
MITAVDDYTHDVGPESNFNESMYFEFHDSAAGIGGFVRLANRPNEGYGERTVCIYLPDGRLGFGFERPRVISNEAMNAGGLSVNVEQPMEAVQVAFSGQVVILDDPLAMENPKAALTSSPSVTARVDLLYRALAPAHEQTFEAEGQSFAPNHYEQLCTVSGLIEIGELRSTIQGHGLRDHSWGPRSWQAPWFYRWMHGSTSDFGFMAAYFGDEDGSSRRGGFVFDEGAVHPCDDVWIKTVRDSAGFQQEIELSISAGQRTWTLCGAALSSVPLRHRGANGTPGTRIVESAMIWRRPDGTALRGMSEYLDQMNNGQPVGIQF